MFLKRPRRDRSSGLHRLDRLMDSYVRWRDETRAVAESYRNWHSAAGSERDDAFRRYVAALDREEHAAHGYKRVVEQGRETRRIAWRGLPGHASNCPR